MNPPVTDRPNPFRIPEPFVVSFSGGRTSAYMLRRILDAFGGKLPAGGKVVFCNTGKERPETLDFVERCSVEWDVPVTWLEYRYESPVPCPTRDPDWPTLDDDPFGERTLRWDRWHQRARKARAKHAAKVEAELSRRKALPRSERKGLPRLRKDIGRHAVAEVNYATASRHGQPLEEVIAARNMLPNVMARFAPWNARFDQRPGIWSDWRGRIGITLSGSGPTSRNG